MKNEEAKLLQAVFDQEPGAFEALLDRYRALIYSVFHGPIFSFKADEMDDLYQSFVVALTHRDYRKLRAFEGRNKASLATFLQVVTTRFALDERRKWARQPRGYGTAGLDREQTMPDSEDEDAQQPDEPALQQEQLDTFHNLLFSLDWKRISAVLWVFRDVQREEIAVVMSTSRANIDALYKRAKDQMSDLHASGAGSRRVRQADPEVLTDPVADLLREVLPYPAKRVHRELLQPDAKRDALLGMVLTEYPRFLCSKAELMKLADTQDLQEQAVTVLGGLIRRLRASP